MRKLPTCFVTALFLAIVLFGSTAAGPTQSASPPSSDEAADDGRLPALGDAGAMTPIAERKLGDQVTRELFRDPDYLDDPVLAEYVDGIWQRLLVAARARGELSPELQERYAWRVLLGRDHTINAFALPGGYFGLHTALLGIISSRDELAAVLAHEMGHITQRHIARSLERQERQTPLLVAAILAGLVTAGKNPQAGAALITGSQALGVQQALSYSRDMEREADRVGYTIAKQAAYATSGFAAMFEDLQKAQRLTDDETLPYLRSHPVTSQRIADMRQREGVSNGKPAAELDTLLIAARARVLSRPGVQTLRQWATAPQTPGFAEQALSERAVAWYTAALCLAELRQWPEAEHAAQELARLVANQAAAARQARLLQAELALQQAAPQRVLQLLPSVPKNSADPASEAGRPELLLRAQALIASGAAEQASDSLQTWLSDHPLDSSAWLQLAAAWRAQNQQLRSLRAEAEARAAELDLQGAANRLRAAQDWSRQHAEARADQIEASIIDARLRATLAALRQQQLEQQRP